MITQELRQQFGYLFDQELLETISNVGIIKHFRKDDIIMDIGDDLNYIPLLLKGNIKIIREDENGHEILLYVLEHGDTCAMSLICCMKKSKSKIRASADKDSNVLLIPAHFMTEWFNTNESWRIFILQSYEIRFNEMLETIDTLAFLKMDERIYKYLMDQVKLNASNTLEITHQKISEDLNTSRVVVSRLLKQLEDEKKIKTGRHKIEVLDF
jgi:CRP/FNR family transcriptional regulator